jgi:quercetin dioxygenase-like cupin family protein
VGFFWTVLSLGVTDDAIEVVHGSADLAGPGAACGSQPVFETKVANVGLTRLGGRVTTPSHHHYSRTFFGFALARTLKLEFEPTRPRAVRSTEGDFFRMPPELVHRVINESDEEVIVATVSVGAGPTWKVVDAFEP